MKKNILQHVYSIFLLASATDESESLFSFPNCVPRFEYAPWLAVKKANVDVLIKLKGNVKRTSGNSLNALRAQNKNRSCFGDATTGFPAKMTSEKQAQKYWWRVTTQIWVVTRHQYGISVLVS